MATVGSLVVKLSAHIAEWTSGLQRAAGDVKAFSASASSAFGSGSIVVGSFGQAMERVAPALDKAGQTAQAATGKFGGLHNIMARLGRLTVGRNNFGFVSALAADGVGLSQLTVGLGSVAVAMLAVTRVAARFGAELKANEEDAKRLGTTLNELRKSRGESTVSPQVYAGATAASSIGTAWKDWFSQAASWMVNASIRRDTYKHFGMTSEEAFSGVRKQDEATAKMWRDLEVGAVLARQKQEEAHESWLRLGNALGSGLTAATAKAMGFYDTLSLGNKKATEFTTALRKHVEFYDKLVQQGKALVETPIDRLLKDLTALQAALIKTEITPEQFASKRKELEKSTVDDLMSGLRSGGGGAASAQVWGSREAWNTYADAIVNNQDEKRLSTERNRILREIRDREKIEVGNIPQ